MPNQTRLLAHLTRELCQYFGTQANTRAATPEPGGDINTCFSLDFDSQRLFVKTNTGQQALAMFKAEFAALEALAPLDKCCSPRPLIYGQAEGQAYLVMTYIELGGPANWQALAHSLAQMHEVTGGQHGWVQDNFIGSTEQINTPTRHWAEFWREQRLKPQLTLARRNGYERSLKPLAEPLLAASDRLLEQHQPAPSLVHGDLWGGNVGFTSTGEPALYDPAMYYGDREVDIAMTELFGGFGAEFYRAYSQHYNLDRGYLERKPLYNLYHLLNHLNLFGSGYLGQCERAIETIITR